MNEKGEYIETTVPAVGEKSGRIMMLHGYNPEYAGQGRGFPRMSHLIQEFSALTDFKTSVIQKAINQSSFVGAVENDQTDPSNFLEGRVAGPVKEYGTPSELTSAATDSTQPVMNFQSMPEGTITQPGSVMIANLKKGDKLKYLQDTSPSAQFDIFCGSFFSSICASTGYSMEVVLKKFNANYSASRATLILCWRVSQIWRDEMASDFLNPVYEMWLSEEIATGRISAPGWSDPRIKAAWLSCEWSGSPMPDIDPVKSLEAGKLAVELSAQTLDDVARNYNGSSGKANRSKLKRMYDELPEPSWGWPNKSGANNNTSQTDKNNQDNGGEDGSESSI
jgi:capsid protein